MVKLQNVIPKEAKQLSIFRSSALFAAGISVSSMDFRRYSVKSGFGMSVKAYLREFLRSETE